MIYIYTCFLTVLSIVEMKTLNEEARVGTNVTVVCSDWNVWTDVKRNDKYLCESPCLDDKHVIIKAAFKETKYKNRIQITNSAEGLFVTFIHLTMSDSKRYYCGAERVGTDSFIEVNLKVVDGPKTTAKTVTVPFTVTNSFTMSYTTVYLTSPTQGTGNAYIGFISVIPIVMLLLILTRKMMKKQQMVVTPTQADTGQSVGPDGVGQSLHSMEDQNKVSSTLTPTHKGAGPDNIYGTLHPSTMDQDHVYGTLNPTAKN